MEDYGLQTAHHYAAYRPPLHEPILRHILPENKEFDHALDIGCGTGHSSHALSSFAKRVMGIEPFQTMLDKAIPTDKVSFHLVKSESLPFLQGSFDLITFAGSLHYAKSQALLGEIERLSRENGYVLAYDFDIQLQDYYQALNIQTPPSDYDHRVNFEGLHTEQLVLKKKGHGKLNFSLNSQELLHLILSVREIYEEIVKISSPFAIDSYTLSILKSQASQNEHRLNGQYFFSLYQVQ
ncbi:MAG: class I SAM-dependent methyltransferase [Bacteroidota bacterium]